MARTYRRSSNGRFAGGGGGGSTAARGASAKPKAAAGKRQAPKNGSAAMAKSKQANPSGQRLSQVKAGVKKTAKFATKHPRLVVGAAAVAAANIPIGSREGAKLTKGLKKLEVIVNKAESYARGRIADKVGIGGKPGANLKASKRGMTGSYKIRSK